MSDYQKLYEIVDKQEQELRLDHFTNEDAWKLGSIIVEYAMEKKLPISVDIVINGYRVFRFGASGTNNYNEIWMQRKINAVQTLHKSSLKLSFMRQIPGMEDIYDGGNLDPAEYAACGGGFPLYVNGIGVIGVLTASGLTDIEDHDLCVEGLCRFLGKDVERIH